MTVIKRLVSVDPSDAYFDISADLVGLAFDISCMYVIVDGMRGPAKCLDKIPIALRETLELEITSHGFYFLQARFE